MSSALSSYSIASSARISKSWARSSTSSVYGGAGGYGTRVSQPTISQEYSVVFNEKETMKSLNDRLATYLEKVRSLESSNKKLESQIREYYEKRVNLDLKERNFSAFFSIITDLRTKISSQQLENQRIIFQIHDAKLTADDYKLKGEQEMNLRLSAETDVSHLSAVRDGLIRAKSDIEFQIQSLKEELVYMKKNHEEEMRLLRAQQSGSVNVEVDIAESVDLTKVLSEVRQQYEALMEKNKTELHQWFQTKVESMSKEITSTTVEVTTVNTELSELKKTYQSYEISRESLLTEVGYMQQTLEETQRRFGVQLTQLQMNINALEAELQQLRVSIETQRSEYTLLLDLKMRLELEIEEYRRLLGGELEKKAVIISKVEEKIEEHKPHIERRTRTIIEEIVDGVVVNHKVDTQVEDIQ